MGDKWIIRCRWLFLLSGIIGIFFAMESVEEILWKQQIVYVTIAAVVLWFFEFIINKHWIPYLGITGIILGFVVIGLQWNLRAIFFVVVFQFSFWMLNNIEKHGGNLAENRMGGFFSAWITLLFLASFLLVWWKADWMYQTTIQAEGLIQRSLRRMAGVSETFSDGVIERGNVYPADVEQLELKARKEVSSPLYLKNFSGGRYGDGRWEEADDTVLFKQMNQNTLHWDEWEDWIPGMYQNLYFFMNKITNEDVKESRELFIQYREGYADNWYMPYFGMWDRKFWNQENPREFRLEYYEQSEMGINWNNVDEDFLTGRDWYQEVQEAYYKEAKRAYTEVPEEEIPQIVKLCRENPKEGLDEITEFIRSYLRENIVYTQTPGRIPLNQDPAEFVLFERKEGYCQHFAAAAVLMYRLYGVPARYAAGYMVSPSGFEIQENGEWSVVVTDQSAHAWPEVFIENYGWVPIEVTYSAQSGSGLGIEISSQDRQVDEEDDKLVKSNGSGQNEEENIVSEESESGTSLKEGNVPWYMIKGIKWGGGISITAFLVWSILWNSKIKRSWMKKGGSRRIYKQLLFILHITGDLREYNGSEKEFGLKLAEKFSCISKEEAQKLISTVNEEAFGKTGFVNPEKIEFAEELYTRIEKEILSRLSIYKKVYFYIRSVTGK